MWNITYLLGTWYATYFRVIWNHTNVTWDIIYKEILTSGITNDINRVRYTSLSAVFCYFEWYITGHIQHYTCHWTLSFVSFSKHTFLHVLLQSSDKNNSQISFIRKYYKHAYRRLKISHNIPSPVQCFLVNLKWFHSDIQYCEIIEMQ